MDNKYAKNEAKKIVNKLIKVKINNESLDTIIDKLLENNDNKMNILIHITKILAEEGYEIKSINPLVIEKIYF